MKKPSHSTIQYSYMWIILFTLLFLTDAWFFKGKLFELGALIPHPHEYWRYFTASFLQQNLIHLLANCIGIYCIAKLAKEEMHGLTMSLVMISANVMTYIIFANVWSFTTSIGASPGIYACLAYMLIVKKQKKLKIDWKSSAGNYLIWFVIIPQFQGLAACFVHGIGFIIGLLYGLMYVTIYNKKSDSQ